MTGPFFLNQRHFLLKKKFPNEICVQSKKRFGWRRAKWQFEGDKRAADCIKETKIDQSICVLHLIGSTDTKKGSNAGGRPASAGIHRGSKFRHGLLQLMIHSIDPMHDGGKSATIPTKRKLFKSSGRETSAGTVTGHYAALVADLNQSRPLSTCLRPLTWISVAARPLCNRIGLMKGLSKANRKWLVGYGTTWRAAKRTHTPHGSRSFPVILLTSY